MGWLVKFRSKSAPGPKSQTLTKSEVKPDFRGIRIRPEKSACREVCQITDCTWLCREAPLLPLDSCDHRLTCKCRYIHLDDRRQEARREADNGLPRKYVDGDRRAFSDRRKSQFHF